MTVTIRPATSADLGAVINLLRDANLPVEDLSADRLALAAEVGGELWGSIGLETFGESALLRSLVVSNKKRGQGIGPALIGALESSCIADGITELWLLTIDADEFFLKHGYVVRAREDAPDTIRSTEEFSGLCPDDAVLMSKNL